MFRALARLHLGVDSQQRFRFLEEWIVRDPVTQRPLWDSYIPFLGPSYRKGGLLILATAQSLAKLARRKDVQAWQQATGLPDKPLYRLYRVQGGTAARLLTGDEVSFRNIAIQPFEDGVLPAVAGVFFRAFGQEDPPWNLDEITKRIAVTNFYKQSLQHDGWDLNPSKLSGPLAVKYRHLTLESYVKAEIDILQPRHIIAFNEPVAEAVSSAVKDRKDRIWVCRINDPSWIKQGMSGAAKPPAGSWHARISKSDVPHQTQDVIGKYIEQMPAPYNSSKSRAVSIYLANYYLAFCRTAQGGDMA